MRKILFTLLLLLIAQLLLAQGAPPHARPTSPTRSNIYYKVQWGHQQEFLKLFLKNHYPLLEKMSKAGAWYR